LLSDAAQVIYESAETFRQMVGDLERSGEYAAKLKDLEHRGDRATHELIALLNKYFVTPLDREDLLTLAVKLDDVTDQLEASAFRLHLYKIRTADRYLIEFGRIISAQAEQLKTAVERLGAKSLAQIRENAVKVNLLENEGDDLLRQALEQLFDDESNPVMLIKLKEIYETLETVTDRAEDVANALETIVMKNS
jgi:predicted phosphate transport protein (TIGR00153 family)